MVKKHKLGLVVGGLLGIWHLIWVLLVAFGVAQKVYNYILKLHMLRIPITVLKFDFWTAVQLIVITAVFGYIMGWVIAWLWNWAHRR